MKKTKLLALLTALALSCVTLASCGNSDTSSETTSAESESQAEKTPETDEEWQQAMFDKSMCSYGNVTAMQDKIQKAQNGEEVTVGYLGGSITEGYTVQPDECYASLTYNYFANKFGTGDNVKYCNAGLSGTPSKLGIMRLDRDLLSSNPDIVFIEFAVNDGNDDEYQNAYESIVRTLLEKDIAVVLLFSVTAEDYSCQDYMKEIGTYYDLPMISYCDALRFLFENNRLTWEEFSNDQSHPNAEGHKLVESMIDYYFDTVMDKEATAYSYPTEPMTSIMQYGAKMLENTDITADSAGSWSAGNTDIASFTNGWQHVYTDGENEPLVFTVKGRMLYLVYKEVLTGNYGSVHVKISADGEVVKETDINAINSSGWGNAQVTSLLLGFEEKEYTIEFSMADGDEAKEFQILAIAYTF